MRAGCCQSDGVGSLKSCQAEGGLRRDTHRTAVGGDTSEHRQGAILRGIRRAAAPGAVVLIIENVLPDDRTGPRGQTLDIIMLAITGGRERPASNLGHELHSAGFRRTAVVETAGRCVSSKRSPSD